jgi:uncharacterized protein
LDPLRARFPSSEGGEIGGRAGAAYGRPAKTWENRRMSSPAHGPLFALSDDEFSRAVGPIPSEAEIERIAARGLGAPPTLAGVVERGKDIRAVAYAHGYGTVRVVGSVARGEEGPRSDLDVAVSPLNDGTAGDPASLSAELEALLGCRVDVVVVDQALAPGEGERLLAGAITL